VDDIASAERKLVMVVWELCCALSGVRGQSPGQAVGNEVP
jgi:hypothetical protein